MNSLGSKTFIVPCLYSVAIIHVDIQVTIIPIQSRENESYKTHSFEATKILPLSFPTVEKFGRFSSKNIFSRRQNNLFDVATERQRRYFLLCVCVLELPGFPSPSAVPVAVAVAFA